VLSGQLPKLYKADLHCHGRYSGQAKDPRFLRYYPTVLSIRNDEFSPSLRVKNSALSVLAAPFLFVPYVAAVRHSHIERSRVSAYSRLIESAH
jgi:hypothetical protein